MPVIHDGVHLLKMPMPYRIYDRWVLCLAEIPVLLSLIMVFHIRRSIACHVLCQSFVKSQFLSSLFCILMVSIIGSFVVVKICVYHYMCPDISKSCLMIAASSSFLNCVLTDPFFQTCFLPECFL